MLLVFMHICMYLYMIFYCIEYLGTCWRSIVDACFTPQVVSKLFHFNSYLIAFLSHLHSEWSEQAWQFWKYLTNNISFCKSFKREMSIRGRTKYLLFIFCELSLYLKVILKYEKTRVYFLEMDGFSEKRNITITKLPECQSIIYLFICISFMRTGYKISTLHP